MFLFQVKLTEYVKVEDSIYRVNDKALCPDEKLQHERVVLFPVSVIAGVICDSSFETHFI